MLKETGYKEKFEILRPWLLDVFQQVKKDLRNEHLRIDKGFCRRYFKGKSRTLVQAEEMVDAYCKDIAEGNEGLAEFIATRYLTKNNDVYTFFESKLKSLTADFDTLDILPEPFAHTLKKEAVAQFGAVRTYLFSVFNSVVFPSTLYQTLREEALKDVR